MIASDRCNQLARALLTKASHSIVEDIQAAARQIAQCSANVMDAANGPLQQRLSTIQLDFDRANQLPDDYDTDLDSPWSNLNLFAHEGDFSWNTIQQRRNLFYQQQMAARLGQQCTDTLALLTSALDIHLTLGQTSVINTSAIVLSLETMTAAALPNKIIQPVGLAQIRLPSLVLLHQSSLSLRTIIQRLAPAATSVMPCSTNMSTAMSVSLLDSAGHQINPPLELIIPRDPALIAPVMALQNISSTVDNAPHHHLFQLHRVNIDQPTHLTAALHFEIRPLDTRLSYMLVYRFAQPPILNHTLQQIDGWSLLCHSNLSGAGLFGLFLDNHRTRGHEFVVFGVREVNGSEWCVGAGAPPSRAPVFDDAVKYTANYEVRTYLSGCYYLDENNEWQSEGLTVGPRTNLQQTQCLVSRLMK